MNRCINSSLHLLRVLNIAVIATLLTHTVTLAADLTIPNGQAVKASQSQADGGETSVMENGVSLGTSSVISSSRGSSTANNSGRISTKRLNRNGTTSLGTNAIITNNSITSAIGPSNSALLGATNDIPPNLLPGFQIYGRTDLGSYGTDNDTKGIKTFPFKGFFLLSD